MQDEMVIVAQPGMPRQARSWDEIERGVWFQINGEQPFSFFLKLRYQWTFWVNTQTGEYGISETIQNSARQGFLLMEHHFGITLFNK